MDKDVLKVIGVIIIIIILLVTTGYLISVMINSWELITNSWRCAVTLFSALSYGIFIIGWILYEIFKKQ